MHLNDAMVNVTVTTIELYPNNNIMFHGPRITLRFRNSNGKSCLHIYRLVELISASVTSGGIEILLCCSSIKRLLSNSFPFFLSKYQSISDSCSCHSVRFILPPNIETCCLSLCSLAGEAKDVKLLLGVISYKGTLLPFINSKYLDRKIRAPDIVLTFRRRQI